MKIKKFLIFGLSLGLLGCFLSACDEETLDQADYNQMQAGLFNEEIHRTDPKADFKSPEDVYKDYINYFEEVYAMMQENYYLDVDRKQFDRFIEQFNSKIYANLKAEGKSEDYVRWRSAALLIENFLRTEEDIFSAFYPPAPAQEYKQTALGVRQDLGIEGKKTEKGFQTIQVEPRSDSYLKGLRIGDIILALDGKKVADLDQSAIQELLVPLINTTVKIGFRSAATQEEKMIEVIPQEYFKQTVFDIPIKYPRVYCLQIQRFNRTTAEDLFRFLRYYKEQGPIMGLILDLRGNPGGPPLAAREISSFFLESGQDFAYFRKKGQNETILDVPEVPETLKYNGPMVILIDKDSGSASELFAGVMQRKGRTILMGQNSAGQVMLKSMFTLSDNSMLLLITSRGHYPDGGIFSFSGLTPDRRIEASEGADIVDYAAKYLIYVNIHPEVLKNLHNTELK